MIKNFKEFLNESESNGLKIVKGVLIKCNDKTVTSIMIPDSVTSIGNRAFKMCIKLASITIPNSVTSIGNDVFDKCPLKDLDLVTALLITKLSKFHDFLLFKSRKYKIFLDTIHDIMIARMHNVFDLVKPYIDDDLWHGSRGSRGVLSLED